MAAPKPEMVRPARNMAMLVDPACRALEKIKRSAATPLAARRPNLLAMGAWTMTPIRAPPKNLRMELAVVSEVV